MRSTGSIQVAGTLALGVALILICAVFVPLRIGQEGSGSKLDPRGWRTREGWTGREGDLLTDTEPEVRQRSKGVTVTARPREAGDQVRDPEQKAAWPLAVAQPVEMAWAGIQRETFSLPILDAEGHWPKDLGFVEGHPDLSALMPLLAQRFQAQTGVELKLAIAGVDDAGVSPRQLDALLAAARALGLEQSGDRLLDAMAELCRGAWALQKDGTVVLGAPVAGVRRDERIDAYVDMQRWRQGLPGDESPPAWRETLERRLREGAVNVHIADAALADAPATLSQALGITVYLDPALDSASLARTVSVQVQSLPPADALRLFAEPLGLVSVLEPEGVVLMTPEQARVRQQEQAAEEAPRRAALTALDQSVQIEAADLRPTRISEGMSKASSFVVLPDRDLWEEDKAFALPAGVRTVRQTLDELTRRNGLHWRLKGDRIYLFR